MGAIDTNLDLTDYKISGDYFTIPNQNHYVHHYVNPIHAGQFTQRTPGIGFSFLLTLDALVGAGVEQALGVSLTDFDMSCQYTA